MVEMLGVLAIIGVLTVGGIAGYSKAMTKYRINKIAEQITQTIANIQTLYAQQSDYYGVSDYDIGQLVVPKGADLYIGYMGSGEYIGSGEDYDKLFVSYTTASSFYATDGKEYQYCIGLASVDWKSTLGDNLLGIALTEAITGAFDSLEQGKSYKGEFNGGYYVGTEHLPIPLNEIAEYCKKNNYDMFTVYVGK